MYKIDAIEDIVAFKAWVVMAAAMHTFDPSTPEAEAGRSLSLRPA